MHKIFTDIVMYLWDEMKVFPVSTKISPLMILEHITMENLM